MGSAEFEEIPFKDVEKGDEQTIIIGIHNSAHLRKLTKWVELWANSAEQKKLAYKKDKDKGKWWRHNGEKIEKFFIADFFELKHLDSKNAIKNFTQKIND